MNYFRSLAIATMLSLAAIAAAQQSAAPVATDPRAQTQPTAQNTVTNVDQHLNMLSQSLDLSADQQAQIRPILKQMLDARQKLVQDTTLTDEARQEKEKALHDKADKQVRKLLNDDQKKKLDTLEQQPHP